MSARRLDTADGVAISYRIDAGPLTSIRFTGYNPSEETIRAIETAWSHSIFDDALVNEVEGLVRRALAERGYFQPSVKATVTANETKTLDVTVETGQRAVERRLLVNADDETLTREIEQWARRSGAEAQAWRDPAAFQRALVEELRRQGHISPDVTAAPPRSDGAAAVIRVDVRAGAVVTVGAVSFTGAASVASERLQEAAGLELGLPYDAIAVDRARERVARGMRGEGFANVRVDVNVQADPNRGQVTVGFVIDEGPRQVLREIAVTGNRSIDRDVIVRTLDLKVGDPLGADAWLRARSRLFDTALFRRVDVTAEPLPAASGERPMRLIVTVEEWPGLRVRYGLEVSEERPAGEVEGRDLTPGFSADVTRRTLFGRAITLGGAVEYQRRERLARGFLNSPTLVRLPIESLLSVEQSHEDPRSQHCHRSPRPFLGAARTDWETTAALVWIYLRPRSHLQHSRIRRPIQPGVRCDDQYREADELPRSSIHGTTRSTPHEDGSFRRTWSTRQHRSDRISGSCAISPRPTASNV